jgi:hypothetical protein
MKQYPLLLTGALRRNLTGIALVLVASCAISVKAESPAGTASEPAEPEQLRGLPRPDELPLVQGPFQPTKASLDELYQWPEWFADAKFGFWAHWGPQCVGLGGWYAKTLYDPNSDYPRHVKQFGYSLEPWSPLKGKKVRCGMPVNGKIHEVME